MRDYPTNFVTRNSPPDDDFNRHAGLCGWRGGYDFESSRAGEFIQQNFDRLRFFGTNGNGEFTLPTAGINVAKLTLLSLIRNEICAERVDIRYIM